MDEVLSDFPAVTNDFLFLHLPHLYHLSLPFLLLLESPEVT